MSALPCAVTHDLRAYMADQEQNEKSARTVERARDRIVQSLRELDDCAGHLEESEYAQLTRAYQLILQGDDIAGGMLIRDAFNRELDKRARKAA